MFAGIVERLHKELNTQCPSQRNHMKIVAPPERKWSTWIGCSILASLDTAPSRFVSKTEYEETGSAMVHRKCFL